MSAPQTEVVITVAGSETGRFVLTPGDYVIGRDEDCHIRLNAALVSRQHAKLILNCEHALIEDLGSSNGTSANDRPVTETTRLWPNQKTQVGTASIDLRRLKVEVSDMSLAPTQAVVKRVLPEEFLREKKYGIGKVIAQDGMGAIINAKDAAIEHTVAMQVMLDSNSSDDLVLFLNEAKVTGQLEHSSIAPVNELSVDENGHPYCTMKARLCTLLDHGRLFHPTAPQGVHQTEANPVSSVSICNASQESPPSPWNSSSRVANRSKPRAFKRRQTSAKFHASPVQQGRRAPLDSFESRKWRMGRDSNPRRRLSLTRFPSVRIRPLCHPSENADSSCAETACVQERCSPAHPKNTDFETTNGHEWTRMKRVRRRMRPMHFTR